MAATPPRPALSGPLIAQLEGLADDLDARAARPDRIETLVRMLQELDETRVVEIDRQIRMFARLFSYRLAPERQRRSLFQRLIGTQPPGRMGEDLRILQQNPALAPVFLAHADGRVREAALDLLTRLDSAWLICALALRINDWVGPVRYAAVEAAVRLMPDTPAAMIAAAAAVVLPLRASWLRGGETLIRLDTVFDRPDVVAALAERISQARTGGVLRVFMEMARRPSLDRHLADIAIGAAQPALRATACEFLITGRARWADGYEFIWLDKTFGRKRRVRRHQERPLTIETDAGEWLGRAGRDRAASVRIMAADLLIRLRDSVADAKGLASELAGDRHADVRKRAEFVLSQV